MITLRFGKNYKVPTGSFLQQIRNAASRLGVKVAIKELPNRVIVKVTQPTKEN